MEKNGFRKKLQFAKASMFASVPVAVAFCNAVVAEAAQAGGEVGQQATGTVIGQRVNNAALGVWGTVKLCCQGALIVVLAVCAAILIIGTKNMKEAVKENFYYIVIGVGILYLAQDFADSLQQLFG